METLKFLDEELGEELCDECRGTGKSNDINNPWFTICSKCNGTGKLDWIEKIMGKKPKKVTDDLYSFISTTWAPTIERFGLVG